MQRTFNWGIIGLGRIARKFADDLKRIPNARLWAVASTSPERARAFADEYGADFAYGRYEDIARCPSLDVVYVATPHVQHGAATLLCLENNVPVLCEKPFAMNAAEARNMIETARRKETFLMEALWTLFIPAIENALNLIEKNEIGRVHTIKADFGFKAPFDPSSRLFDPRLGGGALLDIGIYPALLALAVLGKPAAADILAAATFGPIGVDESCAFTFRYPNNGLALGHCTVAANTPVEAWIYGTEGAIYLAPRWHHTRQITVSHYADREERQETLEFPYPGWGYQFEAAHVMDCLSAGLLESPRAPLSFTLGLSETLDAIREKIGLRY